MFGAEISGIALPLAVIWFIYRLVNNFEAQLVEWAAANQSKTDDLLVRLIGKSLQVVVVIIAAFMLIQNLTGVRVAPLLASLGLGGLAVALAAKDTLANLFGTLTIMMDKPFYLGQRIIVGDKEGSVEAVGYRSTRIRTVEGHQVSIPNSLVVNSMVENVGRRPYLKWETSIGINLQTPAAGIKQAIRIIESALQNHEGMRAEYPPRVFFNDFSNGCVSISVTAWYHPAQWWEYQAWVQKTSLEILRNLGEAGISLSFPSNTVYVANADKSEFKLGVPPGRTSAMAQAGQHQGPGPQKG
jgi:MscS family membrane protein